MCRDLLGARPKLFWGCIGSFNHAFSLILDRSRCRLFGGGKVAISVGKNDVLESWMVGKCCASCFRCTSPTPEFI